MPIFFSHRKEALSLLKSWNKKIGVTVLVFAIELQEVRTKCIFSDFWERTWASFEMARMWKEEESTKKKIRFYRIYTEISHWETMWLKKRLNENQSE